jgi:hypothetical protein
MFDRFSFKYSFKKEFPFKYDETTGEGIMPLKYSILKDQVQLRRMSRFGYVVGNSFTGSWVDRSKFVNFYKGEQDG